MSPRDALARNRVDTIVEGSMKPPTAGGLQATDNVVWIRALSCPPYRNFARSSSTCANDMTMHNVMKRIVMAFHDRFIVLPSSLSCLLTALLVLSASQLKLRSRIPHQTLPGARPSANAVERRPRKLMSANAPSFFCRRSIPVQCRWASCIALLSRVGPEFVREFLRLHHVLLARCRRITNQLLELLVADRIHRL